MQSPLTHHHIETQNSTHIDQNWLPMCSDSRLLYATKMDVALWFHLNIPLFNRDTIIETFGVDNEGCAIDPRIYTYIQKGGKRPNRSSSIVSSNPPPHVHNLPLQKNTAPSSSSKTSPSPASGRRTRRPMTRFGRSVGSSPRQSPRGGARAAWPFAISTASA